MMPSPTRILLATTTEEAPVAEMLSHAGFRVHEATIPTSDNTLSLADLPSVVVLVSAPDPSGVAFARRLRAENTSSPIPLLWLVEDEVCWNDVLEVADVALLRSTSAEQIVAQLQALIRSRETTQRLAARGADASSAIEQLQRLQKQVESDATFARSVLTNDELASISQDSATTLTICHRPATRSAVQFCEVISGLDGSVVLLLADYAGFGLVRAVLAATSTRMMLKNRVQANDEPANILHIWNQHLLAIGISESAVVSAIALSISADGTHIRYACAGLPAPVCLQNGVATFCNGTGPYLGLSESEFPQHDSPLSPGSRIILMAGGETAATRSELRAAAEQVAELQGEAFLERLANDVMGNEVGFILGSIAHK